MSATATTIVLKRPSISTSHATASPKVSKKKLPIIQPPVFYGCGTLSALGRSRERETHGVGGPGIWGLSLTLRLAPCRTYRVDAPERLDDQQEFLLERDACSPRLGPSYGAKVRPMQLHACPDVSVHAMRHGSLFERCGTALQGGGTHVWCGTWKLPPAQRGKLVDWRNLASNCAHCV